MEVPSNPLPGMPLVESPLFNELLATANFSPEIRRVAEDLNRDGYAVIRFPDGALEERAERIKANLRDRYDWATWRHGGIDLRVQDAWQFDPDVAAIALNSAVRDLLSLLYGRRAWPFQTLNFPVGTQQHFHSDSVHFSSIPERFMCGVWVALEDVHTDAGPLCYFPGSHRWPIYTNDQIGHADHLSEGGTRQEVYHDLWEALVRAHGVRKHTFLAKKGDALIWAANLLHGGEPHPDRSRTRWSQVTHYYFDGCAYYTPMESDPFLGKIQFRKPLDLTLHRLVDYGYNGMPVPESFVTLAKWGRYEPAEDQAFDADLYLQANPDVAAAGMNPFEHYLKFGRRERRPLSPPYSSPPA